MTVEQKAPETSSQQPRTGALTKAGAGKRTKGRTALFGALGTLGFLVLWEIVVVFGLLPRNNLPGASETLIRSVGLLADPVFLGHVGSTVAVSFLGLGIAFVIAVPLGLLLGISNAAFALASTVVELLRPLPPIAFVPLAVLIAGQGTEMKAAIVALGCVWPLLTNVIHGVHETDSVAKSTGRSFGWSRSTVIRRVVWPSAVPALITGVRITVSISLILCVGAEYIGGSTQGLGSWLLQQSMQPQGMQAVTAGVVIAGVLGVLVNAIVAGLDRRYAAWARRGEK
ncbi:ABC transporter permease [Ruicaihuangia caeni]|uniref:ABC transporter permease n=1 Tax=Ruicaihuangia caeni TaxID=3042517 RepID=A0AAW6T6B0_9MICO|nr:ABC transporter permease [Klugiella sp. YN-L-19]MDI2099029.1 ABC transporter permease [Klugiella sp. YN-L-19]